MIADAIYAAVTFFGVLDLFLVAERLLPQVGRAMEVSSAAGSPAPPARSPGVGGCAGRVHPSAPPAPVGAARRDFAAPTGHHLAAGLGSERAPGPAAGHRTEQLP